MGKIVLTALVAMLVAPLGAGANSQISDSLRNRLLAQADYIASVYDNYYAPKLWKQEFLKWNLALEVEKAKDRILNAKNSHEYRQAIANLVKSTADYHVSFKFYSTEVATLPFQVKTLEGKSIIVFIDRTKLSSASFPFSEGDELVSMGGRSVADILTEIIDLNGRNVEGTDAALADSYVTKRPADINMEVPRGPVVLGIKRKGQDTEELIQVVWDYTPEKIRPADEVQDISTQSASDDDMFFNSKFRLSSPQMIGDVDVGFEATNNFGLGAKDSFLPDLGEKIWSAEASDFFQAYIYKNANGEPIGFIRIANYTPSNEVKAMESFAKIIEKMEKETMALVIDQNNNPGGSVFYLYSIASMLSDKALAIPQHKIALNPSMVQEAVGFLDLAGYVKDDLTAKLLLGASVSGIPVTYQFAMGVKSYYSFLVDEWNQGKKLTDAFFLYGVDRLSPFTEVQYTKPIVVLINELDFSGGDFFPGILQDNERATIVGARTSGAGGFVTDYNFYNDFGLQKIRITGSIAIRKDNNPLENLGVTPDIPLAMTVEDLQNGFIHYIGEVNKIVSSKIK